MEGQKLQSEYFAWSPGGLRLLDTINQIIDENGGREVMLALVTGELSEDKYLQNKRQIEDAFKIALHYKIRNSDAADMLNMNYHEYVRLFGAYKKKNMIVDDAFF